MMSFSVNRHVKGYAKRSKRRRAWKRGLVALCCAVAAGTVCGLIRPALTAERDAYCGVEEHIHSVEAGCYELICRQTESAEGHTHTADCYETQRVLICGMEEGAAESPAETAEQTAAEQTVMTEKVLICDVAEGEGGHTHSDDCYTTENILTCDAEESPGHVHSDVCYDENGELICVVAEGEGGHTHSDDCYTTENILACGAEESPGHIHTDECYKEKTVVIEAAESIAEEPAAEEAAAPHVHTDECYETQEVLICGLEESEPHTHTADCYGELICTAPEHTHTLECFSNPNAGLDTAEQWRAKARAVALTGDYAADLIAVAKSQLGYTESTENYIVLDDGETVKGYTLYGAWYGDAYGDWCAMFVSFCLDAAGISREAIPYEASCPRWAAALDDAGLYVPAGDYSPYEGDIVFFDWDSDGYADHVGLVYERAFADDGYTMTGITTIEGNSGNAVRENKYDADDSRILGYGALPVNPDASVPAASNGILLAADNYATASGGFMGYVNNMTIQSTLTGSEPFDADNNLGNDSSAENDIVRTFDTIKYNVEAAFTSRTDGSLIEQNAELNFEISMEKKITEARFDVSTMSLLDTGSAAWEIDYWAKDASGNEYIALVERKNGDGTTLYRKDDNGDFTIPTSINAMAHDSTPTGDAAYQTDGTVSIFRQTLTGKLNVCTEEGKKASGTQNFTAGIRVLNAKNDDTFTPTFKAWFTENPNNYGKIENGTSTASTGNQIKAPAVKVSCAPLFNLTLEESTEYVNYLSWYDFSSGSEVTDANLLAWLVAAGSLPENYGEADPSKYTYSNDNSVAAMYNALSQAQKDNLANIRYGRMNALGVTMSLASEANPGTGKGYKGCSLPVGDITFDLALGVTTNVTAGESENVRTDGYSAILWDYRPNIAYSGEIPYPETGKTRGVTDPSKGNMERNLRWRGINYSQYGSRMAVAAYRGSNTAGETANTTVYDSGYWKLTQINGTTAAASAAANADSVYTFTVHDYDFDLDNYLYPDRYYGASAPDGKLRVTDFAFFGGFAQVLYVMPYANSGTVDVSRNLTVGNLELTDVSNQKLDLASGAARGTTVLFGNEVNTTDNTVTSAITQYSTGDFTKRSSFNTTDAYNHTQGKSGGSFLGTDFWGSPQWDENAYAGSNISIMGSVQLSTTSDNTVHAVNLLQLFDSEALSITPNSSTLGTTGSYITQSDVDFGNFYENTYLDHNPQVTYLFAADPDNPQGYDTNAEGMVSYMNTVRETDLVYADKLYWNEVDGCYNIVKYTIGGVEKNLTCVGVLSEVRGCHYIDYCYVRIPITVADDERFVSTSVCTVNAAKVWIDEGAMNNVSWKNGQWDSETGKNTLADYVDITYAWNAGGNGYYSYNEAGSFFKIEYNEDGGYKSGTAGKLNGASLLILGYKAKVNIDNQKHMTPPYYNAYAPAQGETSVTWVVQDIETEIDTTQGTTSSATTSLTIPVNLEYGGNVEAQQQDLFYIAANSSTITEKLWMTDENGTLQLGSDGKPIPVYETDENGNRIPDANGKPIQKTAVKSVSTDSGNPTEITFLGTYQKQDGDSLVTRYMLYTYKVYAQINTAGTGVTYCIEGAPVGQTLPDISFSMNLGNALVDNDNITATAAISGSGDRRAYSETAGNQKSSTVIISKTGGSLLSKKVDIAYGEINASMNYTVTYTNTSDNSLPKAYFYDNLPYNGDGRGSAYGTATDGTIVKDISFESVRNGTPTDDFRATVTVYYPRCEQNNVYSKMSDLEFKNLMYGFEQYVDSNGAAIQAEGDASKSKLDALLESNQFGVLMKAEPASQGTVSYQLTLAKNKKMLDESGKWQTGSWTIEGNTYTNGQKAYEAFLSTIPGVVVKVENMGPDRSIEMKITMGTSGNKAGDVYSNNAWQWSVGSTPLLSNTVQTQIIGRTISGRVWVDENLNGVYDNGEKLLNGVTCTLFKWDETQQKYVPCTTDVAGRALETKTTDDCGQYSFDALPEGKYIVAFSGDALAGYGGATSYQVNQNNDDVSNDGVALKTTPICNMDREISLSGISGGEFLYAIAYTLDESNSAESIPLHSLADIVSGSIPLTNSVELYDHQDLGLVEYAGYELPETGGSGAKPYAIGGGLLISSAALYLLHNHPRRRKKKSASV